MFHSPPKTRTSSGRPVIPAPSELINRLNTCTDDLERYLIELSEFDKDRGRDQIAEDKAKLELQWGNFVTIHESVTDHLKRSGATEEQSTLEKDFQSVRSKTKDASFALRCLLMGHDEDEYSNIERLSDITSLSRLSDNRRQSLEEQLRIATVKRESAKKLCHLETEQKLLELRQERQRLLREEEVEMEKSKLALRRAEVEKDNEIELLQAQLFPYNEKPAVTSLQQTSQNIVDDWFDKIDLTNVQVHPQNLAHIASSSQACASSAEKPFHFSTPFGATALPRNNPRSLAVPDSSSGTIPKRVTIYTAPPPDYSLSTARSNYSGIPAPTLIPSAPPLDRPPAPTFSSNYYSPASANASLIPPIPYNPVPVTRLSSTSLLPSTVPSLHIPAHGPPTTVPTLDPSTRHLALTQLKSSPASTYSGDPHLFRGWTTALHHRMAALHLGPLDIIDVLEAHTSGAPKQLIQTYRAAYCHDPDQALSVIYSKLENRFGNDVEVSTSLKEKLLNFPDIRGSQSDRNVALKLRQMSDICLLVSAHMTQAHDLQILNFFSGLAPVRSKLPEFLNNKWGNLKSQYVGLHIIHPPFSVFCEFVETHADRLCADLQPKPTSSRSVAGKPTEKPSKSLQTTTLNQSPSSSQSHQSSSGYKCSLHRTNLHELVECKAFLDLDTKLKRLMVSSFGLCFRCAGQHLAANCQKSVRCSVCNSEHHLTMLHPSKTPFHRSDTRGRDASRDGELHTAGGRRAATPAAPSSPASQTPTSTSTPQTPTPTTTPVSVKHTLQTNSSSLVVHNFSKVVKVEVCAPFINNKVVRAYAILDDQSDQSFATSELFDNLDVKSDNHNYCLGTLSDTRSDVVGRVAEGLTIRGINSNSLFELPKLFENNVIPDCRNEAATPLDVQSFTHLSHLSSNFESFDENITALLLLGRDSGPLVASKIHDPVPFDELLSPVAYETALGWVLVGLETNHTDQHTQEHVHVSVKRSSVHDHFTASLQFPRGNVFTQMEDDNDTALSIDDRKFMSIIENNIRVNEAGSLEMPLPLRHENFIYPNNRDSVYRREKTTVSRLSKTPKIKDAVEFMEKIISSGHVEKVPPSELDGKPGQTWYIPLFPVVHPKKMSVRMVFDSAAQYAGVSLNSTLLPGPDQNNLLRGVIYRFREHEVAFVGDVQCMYHSFFVPPYQRDLLRFYWFKDNISTNELIQYRAKVHIFGNCSSPAIAIIGLRKAAEILESNDPDQSSYKSVAFQYIFRNFYVDDGLGSAPTIEEAIGILSSARQALSKFNIRLHKIVSSHKEVLDAFPAAERNEKTIIDLETNSSHKTLGVTWDVASDSFRLDVKVPDRNFTKRGLLSIIHSVYDPIGIVCPVILGGKLLQREIIPTKNSPNHDELSSIGWDDPLPKKYEPDWNKWKASLQELNEVTLRRCYKPMSFGSVASCYMVVYCDAAKDSIGHVVYLRMTNDNGKVHVAFVCADSRVAPRSASSIPRLELCSCVEASCAASRVKKELTIPIDKTIFYTDSKVALGYIYNEQRRFMKYVSRRVEIIRANSSPSEWHFVSTNSNPADISTRPISPSGLVRSCWLTGPSQLWNDDFQKPIMESIHTEISTQELPETESAKVNIVVLSTKSRESFIDRLLELHNTWTKIVKILTKIVIYAWKLSDRARLTLGEHVVCRGGSMARTVAIRLLLHEAQKAHYYKEIVSLTAGDCVSSKSKIAKLSPIIDSHGTILVGGRLNRSQFPWNERHPVLIPSSHPVGQAILNHFHHINNHQGRHVTHGAIIAAGFHLDGGRQAVRHLLQSCVACRRLRSPPQQQVMADLPPDRTTPAPPFSHTGLDVMGPWRIHYGATTRGRTSEKKIWCVLFTCLASRAIHVEIISSLDTSAFQNSLRRFISIRGPCRLIRSDRGTNFISAQNQLDMDQLGSLAQESGCNWEFNPPHASHFGGSWERKIGQVKRILDSSLSNSGKRVLSYDEFNTFIQEAVAIVNSTPLYEISSDPNDPSPVSPFTLLTLRSDSEVGGIATSEHDILSYGKRRWRRVQHLVNCFWREWQKNYLQTLQVRQKWLKTSRPISAGDVVIMKTKNCPRNTWPLALVESVKHSSDNHVRSVTLKLCKNSANGIRVSYLERPISEIVLLMNKN